MILLEEVIQAVEAVPAERLSYGATVNNEGCLCAIGAYAYAKDPKFRRLADELYAKPEDRMPVGAIEVASTAYPLLTKQFADAIEGDRFVEAVYTVNDNAFHSRHGISNPYVRKAEILKRLGEIKV